MPLDNPDGPPRGRSRPIDGIPPRGVTDGSGFFAAAYVVGQVKGGSGANDTENRIETNCLLSKEGR